MSNAYRTGAAMARLSVAGLGGLSGTSKKGKKKGKRAAPRQTSGLKRVVNAFIAGTSDREGCKWDVDAGTGSCQYATDGNELRVHGETVARRMAPATSGNPFKSRAAKQIQVCAKAKYALDTKDAKERRENSDLLGAVNAIMDTVRTGVRVREVKDYDKGFRSVLSAFRFGGAGSAAIVGGGRALNACVTVELTEEMRARALSNALSEEYAQDLIALKKEVSLPFKDKRKPLSRDELLAVLANVQNQVAAGADPTAAFQKIRADIKAGKSIMAFPF